MATMIRNVWLDGTYYGPDHGNADDVPDHLLGLVPDDAWSDGGLAVRDRQTAADVAGPQRYELLAKADELGIKVDRRWGTRRLVAAIADAEEAATHAH